MKKVLLVALTCISLLIACEDDKISNDNDLWFPDTFTYKGMDYVINIPPLITDTLTSFLDFAEKQGNLEPKWNYGNIYGKLFSSKDDIFNYFHYSIDYSYGMKDIEMELIYREDLEDPFNIFTEYVRQKYTNPPFINGYKVDIDLSYSRHVKLRLRERIEGVDSQGFFEFYGKYFDIQLPPLTTYEDAEAWCQEHSTYNSYHTYRIEITPQNNLYASCATGYTVTLVPNEDLFTAYITVMSISNNIIKQYAETLPINAADKGQYSIK